MNDNQLVEMDEWDGTLPEEAGEEEELVLDRQEMRPRFILKKLKQKHRDACALVAQGMKRELVARITGYTPEYISMLMTQPLCVAEVRRLNEYQANRLEAMFGKTVDVIAEGLDNGNIGEKLKAARLQAEITKRLGRNDAPAVGNETSEARLANLAHRLVGLLEQSKGVGRDAQTFDATSPEVQNAQVV